MKLEMDNNAFWFATWTMVVSAIVLIVVTACVTMTALTEKYTSRGYTRTTLPGSHYEQWVLPEASK